jgi:hypothetical protein
MPTTGFSDISPHAVKIDKLLHRMEEDDIKIPAFQRGFVWKQNQVIDLLDSIYNDYPIGSVLLWNSYDKLKASRNIAGFDIPERAPQYPVNYVLDGQQRLSAIYGTFCKNRNMGPESERYKIDPGIFGLSFDLEDEKFIPDADATTNHHHFKAASLFESLLLLMAQAGPQNLTNGTSVDIGAALSKYNAKEYHHVFPKAFLTEKGVEDERINSVCNFCFLPSDSNKKISRKAPSDYFFNLIPPLMYDGILRSNLLPLEKEIYSQDDFDQFLKRRAAVVLEFLGNLVRD